MNARERYDELATDLGEHLIGACPACADRGSCDCPVANALADAALAVATTVHDERKWPR